MQIYKITNKINQKSYIGVTTRGIEERFKQHKYNRYNLSTPLSLAFKKYGTHNFFIEEIDVATTEEELFEKEKYYIKKYDTYNTGYNATLGGEGNSKVPYSDKEIIESYHSTKSSIKVAKNLNIGENTVLRVLDKHNVTKYGSGYEASLRISEEEIEKTYHETRSIKITAETLGVSPSTVSSKLKNSKVPLYKYGFSKEEELDICNYYINSFYSMTQLQEILGINRKVISRILHSNGVVIDNTRNKVKPISMFNKEYSLVFGSIQECAEYIVDNNISESDLPKTVRSGIEYSLKHNTPYYGYKFNRLKI